MNESETRAHLIDPILRALGYRTLDHVRREYRLEASGQFVDYMLVAGDQRVVVEAKPSGLELSPKDASQLVGYCAQEGIRWALLTNGGEWQVFDTEVPGNWEAKRVAHIDLAAALRSESLADALVPVSFFAHELLREDDSAIQQWALEERARALLDRLVTDPKSTVIAAVVSAMQASGIDLEPEDAVALLRRGTAARSSMSAPSATARSSAAAPSPAPAQGRNFYVFPAGDAGGFSAVEHLHVWLRNGFWGVRQASAHRKRVRAGDECCFYAKSVGIVAVARIAGDASQLVPSTEWPGPNEAGSAYKVPLANVEWLPEPIVLDAKLRGQLDAFVGKEPDRPWSWFIQSTNRLTEHDFRVITGRGA